MSSTTDTLVISDHGFSVVQGHFAPPVLIGSGVHDLCVLDGWGVQSVHLDHADTEIGISYSVMKKGAMLKKIFHKHMYIRQYIKWTKWVMVKLHMYHTDIRHVCFKSSLH